MKKKKSGRVFRQGKGKAFLRFLVGEMVLLLVCACVYLFVLQGTIELPGVERMLKENVNLGDLSVDIPAARTATPSPEPTSTPVPQAMYAQTAALEELGDLSQADGSWLKTSLFHFSKVVSENCRALSIAGHAYLEGMDAQNSSVYLLIENVQSGTFEAAWRAERSKQPSDLSFEGANGMNLEQAYYDACIDVSGCAGASYRVFVCVKNGERTGLLPLDDQAYHFRLEGDQLETVFD